MTANRKSTRVLATSAIALTIALASTGCEWNGLNSVPLPGTEGQGDGAYTVQIQMPNVTTMSQNSPVRVNDVTVGAVTGIEVQDWHALVTVSLNKDVQLPANATAKIGQTSLLGSQHLELAPPVGIAPQGTLKDGDVIPLERAGAYPTTEQTLSSLSVVLNGGGLAQINDITRELNAALGGREDSVRDLLPQLDQLVGSLDDQRTQIISAMEGIDRLAGTVNQQTDTLNRALDSIPPALEVLVAQRQNLTNALVALGNFSDTATRVINESGDDLKANLASLSPLLEQLAGTGNNLTEVLSMMLTFPFTMKHMDQVFQGDYANLNMMIDMTNARLTSNFIDQTGLGPTLAGVEGALGTLAGTAGQTNDPLKVPDPKKPDLIQPQPKPATPDDIPSLQIPGLPQLGAPTP
ncbi:MCE family protein [Prescottella equi]|uniref:MCE family protein n=1 Tax=Rhodococcus hoagii TaxID=43767 RepID=UPI0009BF2E1A|nr:MCE family protein [Prescottella equi]MBM4725539.1 MCE family protein [Prescottella equi]NKR42504.1 MCE family protein [Prescottella equi]NKR75440.1 MCE family protein [Prescottella equi]NKS17935.1 MCE family protein [Prescottella equi]NKS81088.1 MCE family protein [Prescottella equi]